jgi:hypothetical protein
MPDGRLARFARKSPRDQLRAIGATLAAPFRRAAPKSFVYPRVDYPALTATHVAGCQLFANRYDMIAALGVPSGATIAEIGVAGGAFTEFLLDRLEPAKLVAIDTFEIPALPTAGKPAEWLTMFGATSDGVFAGLPHQEFYRRRFAGRSEVEIVEALSYEGLARYPDSSFDLVYIDAGHGYDDVSRDAAVAKTKIKPEGVIVFNDYIMFDHLLGYPYGIVQAVNRLVVAEDWRVAGFALHPSMFCDIALRRARS